MINAANRFVQSRERGICCRCDGPRTLYVQQTAGGIKGQYRCDTCNDVAHGGNSSTSLKHLSTEEIGALPRIDANKEPCWVCMRVAVLELHHLAPQAQFGKESDLWPTVRVCHECHRKWEERMCTHPWRDA